MGMVTHLIHDRGRSVSLPSFRKRPAKAVHDACLARAQAGPAPWTAEHKEAIP